MKKILLLTTLLSSIILANNEATMNINATVIKPLKVEVTQHIDLGTMVNGTFKRVEGAFKITGEPEAKYIAYIKELGEEKGEGKIELSNVKNPNTKLSVDLWTDIFPSLGPTTLTEGENFHTIGVDANISDTQPSGQYKGSVTMAVRYE